MSIRIVPSILAADFAALGDAVREAEAGGADAIQIDVMDGHFVPNLTIGAPVVRALRAVTTLPLDVHLMIENPGDVVETYREAGADILTVHVEACRHLHRVVGQIREAGMAAGVALNPATPLVAVQELLDDVDLLLIMTVNPGFGGQRFIESMVPKVRRLRETLVARGRPTLPIEVDGGVSPANGRALAAAGATWFVAGSSIYGAEHGVAAGIRALREVVLAGAREHQKTVPSGTVS